ncbi:MAG: tetratricopeptide repeat protein [Candidatus Electrothrix sp. AUS1_2]|nr:tetratricopeptide repeat protein [Candidatus Electrothrix sp. AUS1_2]
MIGEANVFCALGDLECSLGNYKKSQEAYDKAASLYNTNNNLLGLANVLIGQGNLARVRNENSQALTFYDQATKHYKTMQDDLGRANALTGLAHAERKLDVQYHLENSSKHYKGALELYKEIQDTLGMANVLAGQGDLETLQGNHEAGQGNLEILQGNHEKSEKHYREAKRHHETAETNYLSAQRYYKDLGDKLGQADVALGLGRLEAIRGRFDSALIKCIQAEDIYRALNNLLGLANALTERGHLQGMLSKTKEDRIVSLNIYREAKKLYSDLKNRLGEAHVLCGVGWLKKGSGDLDGAKTAFKEARCLYGQLEHYQGKDVVDGFLNEIERDEKLAKTDIEPNDSGKKDEHQEDDKEHDLVEWVLSLISGAGPWITDKLWPFVKTCPGKLWQLTATAIGELGALIATSIILILMPIVSFAKKAIKKTPK